MDGSESAVDETVRAGRWGPLIWFLGLAAGVGFGLLLIYFVLVASHG